MKKTISIIVTAIFLLAMASVSLAATEKADMAKPAENTPAETPKSVPNEMEKLGNPSELKEQEKQKQQELTPKELKELKEFEEQEKEQFKNLKDWE